MYAVFEDGSRQYRVSEGDIVKVDFREAEPGASVTFDRVLLYANGEDVQIGRPTVAGLTVVGEVVDHPSIKTRIQHYRRRKNYRRLRGHRQPYTAVRVKSIG
jgi:large subunit ribosomal protein L21